MKAVIVVSVDYKKLCNELFETTDVAQLKKIAEKLNKKNSRGAGRKKTFTFEQITKMKEMQAQNISQQKIAEHFGTSRQTISKYLSEPFYDKYGMRIDFMYKTSVCTTIFVDFWNEKIKITNKTDDILHRAFGVNENPTWDDFNEFLADRCFSQSRGDKKSVLMAIGVDSYDPIQIVEQTKGKTYEDSQWMRFKYASN